MNVALCLLLLILCVSQPASAQYPSITADISQTPEGVRYTYTLTNMSETAAVYSFGIRLPVSTLSSITWIGVPNDQWGASTRGRGDQWYAQWLVQTPGPGILPGDSGIFSLMTEPGVPTGYDYAPLGETNWVWSDWDGGGRGNTILPVPVPEPQSLLALGSGLVAVGLPWLRRRVRAKA